jgi:hypothetical protein
VYPKRPGNNKAEAYTQWLKRTAAEDDPLDMLEATRRYAKWVEAQGWPDRRLVLMARTFYGPNRRFADDWTEGTSSLPLVDEFGVFTAHGERVTRPVRIA